MNLAEWLPDQTSTSGGLNQAQNVLPRVDGYGPLQSLQTLSTALPAAFKGGGAFIATNGTSTLLVGTATGLVQYAAGAWTSIVSGLTITDDWRFVQFGNNVVAVNGSVTKAINLTTGVATTLAGAPTGKSVAVVGDYVVIGQDTSDLLKISTSAFNDYTGWTPGVAQSTVQPMLTGGEVMGLAGGEYGVILQRQRLVRMSRTGDGLAPFQYDQITDNVGCACKASVAAEGRSVFFLSDRGFMALENGQQLVPIGSEKIDRTFQAAVPRDDYERMFSAVDPQNKLVIWCIPGLAGSLWIYNFELNRWAYGALPIDGIFSGFTSSQTLEQVSATYPNLDTMPYSLDDPRFQGGSPRLYGVSGGLLGTFTGANLAALFETSFSQDTPGRKSRYRQLRPITDATAGMALSVDCRDRLGDVPNVTVAGPLRVSGAMPIRTYGRYAKLTWSIAAATTWSFAQGYEAQFEAGGER